jgi:hypothetical protein
MQVVLCPGVVRVPTADAQRPPRTISDIDAELARYKAERAAKRARQQLSGADDASAAISPADTTQSEIAATARAFYGRRAAGETEAASLVAGNDGERMV